MSAVLPEELCKTYNRYLQEKFGTKIYKVPVVSGLSCPTRDGTLGTTGCAFCDEKGSSSFYGALTPCAPITEQLQRQIPAIRERFNATGFLAYFQSFSNTYGSPEKLRALYETALGVPEIRGLCIGTRPDCLGDPVLNLLQDLARQHYMGLELGVQSFEDATLQWLERGHDAQTAIQALKRLKTLAPDVPVCVHLILGSPTDSPATPREAALLLNQLGVHGVKLHQLMILENTKLASRWKEKPFPVLDMEQYAQKVGNFLDHLSPEIYVERLSATASNPTACLAPDWSRKRWLSHNRLREILQSMNIKQGRALQHALT